MAQHTTHQSNAASQWFSHIMSFTFVRYSVLAATILAVIVGLALVSMVMLHLPVAHMLTSTLQLFNKVPFHDPWPLP